jgi:hypothetical protein
VLIAHDTFIKYLKAQLTGVSVSAVATTQDDIQMNGVTLRFIKDKGKVGTKVWEGLVAIDVYTDDTSSTASPERRAQTIIEALLSILENARTTQMYVNGAWISSAGYLSWDVNELEFRDVPHDSYVHKNLVLPVWYFR